jgi:hypothetical protein
VACQNFPAKWRKMGAHKLFCRKCFFEDIPESMEHSEMPYTVGKYVLRFIFHFNQTIFIAKKHN